MLSGFDAPQVVRRPAGSRLKRNFRRWSQSEEMCVLAALEPGGAEGGVCEGFFLAVTATLLSRDPPSRRTLGQLGTSRIFSPPQNSSPGSLSTDEVLTRSDVPVLADDPVHQPAPVGGVKRPEEIAQEELGLLLRTSTWRRPTTSRVPVQKS